MPRVWELRGLRIGSVASAFDRHKMDLDGPDILKLLGAVAAGALVGLERELHDKPAGFRTNILICLGAALFTMLSLKLGVAERVADRTRIAAQIVTGVGFLGAGAIIRQRGQVVGLTTAATIWAIASVGMAFGAGEFALGAIGTLLTAGVLFGLSYTEYRITRWRSSVVYELTLEPTADAQQRVRELVRERGLQLRSWSLSKRASVLMGRLVVIGPGAALDDLDGALMQEPGVRTLNRL